MTAPRICVSTDTAADSTDPVELAGLRRQGLEFTLLERSAPFAEMLAALAGCDLLVSIRPTSREACLWLALAAGKGIAVFVLSADVDASSIPADAKVFATAESLVSALGESAAKGDSPGRFISARDFRSFNPCQAAADFFDRRYPGGAHTRDWTLDEQLDVLMKGGGPWLQSMFDRGVLHLWPMNDVDLTNADLPGLRLNGAVFRHADLTAAMLDGCQLRQADLGSAKLDRASMTRSVLRHCDLTEAHLAGINLAGSHLTDTILDGAAFLGARLDRTHLRGSSARHGIFRDAQLSGVTLRDVDLSGADFQNATLDGTHFVRCDLEQANFAKASLRGALFIQSNFERANAADAVTENVYIKRHA